MMEELDSKEQWRELVDGVDTVLFDCDGKFFLCMCAKQQAE